MTEQMKHLSNLIETAESDGIGSDGAVAVLREICHGAADKAPKDDLIRMAQFLYDLRVSEEK